jgi:hypothetical protein
MIGPEAFFALLGVIVGGALSLLVQRWRYSADQWSTRTTEFCGDVIKVANDASEFWLTDRKKDDRELTASAMRLRGGLMRLSAIQVLFQSWCNRADAIKLQKLFGELDKAITGGDFHKVPRKANPDCALEVQAVAAELVGHLHTSRIAASTIRATMTRTVQSWIDKPTLS